MHRWLLPAVAAVASLVASGTGCFSPSYPSGKFPCGPDGECPSDFHCAVTVCVSDSAGNPSDAGQDGPIAPPADVSLLPDVSIPLPDAIIGAPDTFNLGPDAFVRPPDAGPPDAHFIILDSGAPDAPIADAPLVFPDSPLIMFPDVRPVPDATHPDVFILQLPDAAVPDAAIPTATVTVNWTGPGGITTSPVGNSCGSDCLKVAVAVGNLIVITPTPTPGFSVQSWMGGGCEQSGAGSCTFSVETNTQVTVNFCDFNYYVAATGDDRASGTCVTPFATITPALSLVPARGRVGVGPGTYTAPNETFPLEVPTSVSLIGDEAQIGADVVISGGGPIPESTNIKATIQPGDSSTIAGFTITDAPTTGGTGMGVVITEPGVTLRNNTITGSITDGIYFPDPNGVDSIIRDNIITNNSQNGITFYQGGEGTLVEGNTVTGNSIGVEVDSCDACLPDLGGGEAQSLGLNTLSCNSRNDLWAESMTGSQIDATNDRWDHVPQTSSCTVAGSDLCNFSNNVMFSTPPAPSSRRRRARDDEDLSVPTTLAEIVSLEDALPEPRLLAALRHARGSGEALIAVLVEVEGLSDDSIAAMLAQHLDLPLTPVSEGDVDVDALRDVGVDLARARRVVPLSLAEDEDGGRVMRVAMADPTDVDTLGELEAQSGCHVIPVLARLTDVDDTIARVYRGFVTAVMHTEGTDPGEAPPVRVPFGGNLSVATPARSEALHTAPFHNLEEDAPLELRHRALLEILIARGIISVEEYWNELRRLLEER